MRRIESKSDREGEQELKTERWIKIYDDKRSGRKLNDGGERE